MNGVIRQEGCALAARAESDCGCSLFAHTSAATTGRKHFPTALDEREVPHMFSIIRAATSQAAHARGQAKEPQALSKGGRRSTAEAQTGDADLIADMRPSLRLDSRCIHVFTPQAT